MYFDEKYQKNSYFILLFFLFSMLIIFSSILSAFIIPLFFAFFTAMFLHTFIIKLNNAKVPYWLSIIIVYSVFTVVIAVILTVLIISFLNFLEDLPGISQDIRKSILTFINNLSNIEIVKRFLYKKELNDAFIKIVTDLLSLGNLKLYIIKPIEVTINILKSFGLYIIYLIFIIPGMDKLPPKILKAFPDKKGKKINKLIINITEQIQSYIFVKSVISLITGILSFIICIFFGIEYALLWGTIIFLFNYIPYIGSIIAVIFPLFLSIIQFQSFTKFFFLALSLILVQTIVGNILEPKFMSKSVNLSPLIIIISLLIFGFIWGIAGVILAVPIISALNLIFQNIEALKPVSIFMSVKESD